jgi:hypothetical protein
MPFDYANTAATALRLLTKFGAEATLTHNSDGTYDPDTGGVTETTATDTVQACVFPIADKLIDGTLIQAGDRTAYVSAVGVTNPRPNDILLWEGISLRVINAKSLGPAGVYVLHELQVRNP